MKKFWSDPSYRKSFPTDFLSQIFFVANYLYCQKNIT